jgi:hypothetical protein
MALKTFGNDVYDAYVRGYADSGRNYSRESVYFEGDTIYSYGSHFPMAIRYHSPEIGEWYLVNGDKYSVTTGAHQSKLRQALQYKNTFVIPFSALEQACIEKKSIVLLDQEDEKFIPVKRVDKDGNPYEAEVHLLGAALFTARRYGRFYNATTREWTDVDEHATFLSGLDETGRNPWAAYFLAQLDQTKVDDLLGSLTVEDGYEVLKPEEVREAEAENEVVLRQGEWFFVRVDDILQTSLNILERKKPEKVEKNGLLPNREEAREKRHKATRMVITDDGKVFARGTVRHTGGDHKMLKLDGGWYQVFENTQIAGWSARGDID